MGTKQTPQWTLRKTPERVALVDAAAQRLRTEGSFADTIDAALVAVLVRIPDLQDEIDELRSLLQAAVVF